MDILIEQEIALHQFDTRKDKNEVARLLHSSFKEVGESGNSYDYKSIVEMMESEKPSEGYIYSEGYECIQLEPMVYLLLYKSTWVDGNGSKSHFAKRSSVWVFAGERWQMKYHQGTPCSEF
jgi:hypothetical protein